MPEMRRPVFPDRRFDIRDFGAKEGGTEKVTLAIHDAIAAAAGAGGGVVVVPEGKWLTGAIHLESNINLRLLKGAELLFSQDAKDYLPVVFSRHEDIECYKYSSFIHAEGKQNIGITGEGVLNGQGKPWWAMKETKKEAERQLYKMGAQDVPVGKRVFDGTGGKELRPAFFQPVRCTNVLVEGVTFLYGAFWTIAPTYCENVIVRRVRIVTEGPYGHVPNGDGVDPSSSRNVLIEECVFDTGDDCVALKAGRDSDGLRVGLPTENVVIRRCRGLRGHGGIVIGSETSGGIRNVYAYDCAFTGTDRVVRIKSARGRGGVIENMWFENLCGDSIKAEALHVNMLYAGTRFPAATVGETTPRVKNIHFKKITIGSGAGHAIALAGLPELPIENVTFDSVTASAAQGITLTDARGIRLSNLRFTGGAAPLAAVADCQDVTFDRVTGPDAPRATVRVEGEKSGGIVFHNVDPAWGASWLSLGPGVGTDAVVVAGDSAGAGGNMKSGADAIPRAGSWARRIADSFLLRHPDAATYDTGFTEKRWNYEQGLMLLALYRMYQHTEEPRYFDFIERNLARYIEPDGRITSYRLTDYNLDLVAPGRALLAAYQKTGEERYRRAADTLRRQLREQPRTSGGGFWHKKIYPYQMWLDGLFMAEPFYAMYSSSCHDSAAFDDIAHQFIEIARRTRDAKTGLYYHGWDEHREQPWADKATGCSPSFWGRAMGWYIMGLVDVLEYFPVDHPKRKELIAILRDVAAGMLKYRDRDTGLWYLVVDQGKRKGNYLESSSACMFTYAFAKGAARGYLDGKYFQEAERLFTGILRYHVSVDGNGFVDLHNTIKGAGLGGTPYRDGTFAYYAGEAQRTNDMKGVGPLLMAAIELEKGRTGQRVLLDCYYNNEWRISPAGTLERFHYVWDDTTNSGFSQLAKIVRRIGAYPDTLNRAPSRGALKDAAVYIIVDPDTPLESPDPHIIRAEAAETIVQWVRDGGTLVLLGNDKGNAEFGYLNGLAERFGIHFNEDSRNRVVGRQYDTGTFENLPDHPIFAGVRRVFIKELSTLRLQEPAHAILTEGKDVIISFGRLGKGRVFAVGDPWFYNEYMDERRLPAGYGNARTAENLFRWLLSDTPQGGQ